VVRRKHGIAFQIHPHMLRHTTGYELAPDRFKDLWKGHPRQEHVNNVTVSHIPHIQSPMPFHVPRPYITSLLALMLLSLPIA
jgi:hypothetical protein